MGPQSVKTAKRASPVKQLEHYLASSRFPSVAVTLQHRESIAEPLASQSPRSTDCGRVSHLSSLAGVSPEQWPSLAHTWVTWWKSSLHSEDLGLEDQAVCFPPLISLGEKQRLLFYQSWDLQPTYLLQSYSVAGAAEAPRGKRTQSEMCMQHFK